LIGRSALSFGGSAEGIVVLVRRDPTPGKPGNNCAVGEWKRSFAVGLEGYIVAQFDTQVVQFTADLRNGNHAPVPVSRRNFSDELRRTLLVFIFGTENIRRDGCILCRSRIVVLRLGLLLDNEY